MNIDEIMEEFLKFSIPTFKLATSQSSILKLEDEIKELKSDIFEFENSETIPIHKVADEYADCIMCIFDSAKRLGLDVESIRCALSKKLIVNKNRKWIENTDKTYSHIK